MKILVLGATGPTGRQVLDLSLKSGDAVTVLVRDPGRLGDLASQVSVVQGDATSVQDLSRALRGQDAVISALGTGKSTAADELFSRAAVALIDAAKQEGVSRLVWMSSFGVGDTFTSASLPQKLLFGTLVREIYADKAKADSTIRESGLDWTLVYPSALTEGPARGTFRAAELIKMRGLPSISRADVAAFMHQAINSRDWIRRSAVISD